MGVTTTTAAIHITPVVIKTLFAHYRNKTKKNAHYYVTAKEGEEWEESARDELVFDEAFHIVKAFIELGTQNSIESLQAFTNTHIPSPYWVAVAPVLIPLKTCNDAADVLIKWFGPDDLFKVVGGERWWQIRGLDGVEGEWITEKSFLGKVDKKAQKRKAEVDTLIEQMDHLEPVMLYVHGGGYFWGSINTHRYQTIRYAKQMKGRCFMVNYRKAPQYPWPCPLHDVIAAYLYLIDPPSDALHKPISPSKIVLAGDSAGGALCLTALTVLRDMKIPLPSGAVLISPWVDLTHSFESVMTNTKTDIIPPHGFVHKPSMLWPVDPLGGEDKPRIRETQTTSPPPPGHADTLDPGRQSGQEQNESRDEAVESSTSRFEARDKREGEVKPQSDKHFGATSRSSVNDIASINESRGAECSEREEDGEEVEPDDNYINKWEPKPPKVLMDDPDAVPLEITSQIQQYAMNEQLSHPLVSPILQGSLCNLCPLYIIAGNGEVLCDEIIHVAHRAAHPTDYPVRKGVLKEGRRQKENVKKFTTPTKVHLQVYDEMPHVLTAFIFIEPAKYAYRAIAQFARHVTSHPAEHLECNPFPELHRPECVVHADGKHGHHSNDGDDEHGGSCGFCCQSSSSGQHWKSTSGNAQKNSAATKARQDESRAAEQAEAVVEEEHAKAKASRETKRAEAANRQTSKSKNTDHAFMIRERVDVHGRVRLMEPVEEIAALRVKPATVGLIKQTPVLRWYAGQDAMDRKFAAHARKIVQRREKMEKRVERMLAEAREQGLILTDDQQSEPEAPNADRHAHDGGDSSTSTPTPSSSPSGAASGDALRPQRKPTVRIASSDMHMSTVSVDTSAGGSVRIDEFRRWGPLDLDEERPPPTAIAGRRDTLEALALIKKHVYHTAPVTHRTIPRMRTSHIVRAVLDPQDRVSTKPMQSVSEQQTSANMKAMHGLSLWGSLTSYFMRRTSHTVADGVRTARSRSNSL